MVGYLEVPPEVVSDLLATLQFNKLKYLVLNTDKKKGNRSITGVPPLPIYELEKLRANKSIGGIQYRNISFRRF
jgi:hypothetical protein